MDTAPDDSKTREIRASMAPAAPIEDSRPLGDVESLTLQMHKFAVLTSATRLTIRGPLTEALVRRALDWLQAEHSMLRAHIEERGFRWLKAAPYINPIGHLETRGTGPIPLRVVIDADPGAPNKVLYKELNTPIPLKDPRVRVVMVRASEASEVSTLVVTVDHTVADAITMSMIMKDLLDFIGNPDGIRAPKGLQEKLPPALESIMPKRTDSGTDPYNPIIRLPLKKNSGWKMDTLVERRFFTKEETDAIKAKVKAHRVTVHGLVAASILNAMHRRFGSNEMTICSTVEFRAQGKPRLPSNTFGCFVDLLRTKHNIDQPIWALAQDVAQQLIKTLIRDQATATMFKWPSWNFYRREGWGIMTHRMRNDGLVMTTAGETGIGTQFGPFVLEDQLGIVSQSRFGASVFAVAQEREGAMDICLYYAAHCLATEDAVAMADMAADTLRNLPE